jgi:hypothetical protein
MLLERGEKRHCCSPAPVGLNPAHACPDSMHHPGLSLVHLVLVSHRSVRGTETLKVVAVLTFMIRLQLVHVYLYIGC